MRPWLVVGVGLLGVMIGAGSVVAVASARDPKRHEPSSNRQMKAEMAALSEEQQGYAARLAALEAKNVRVVPLERPINSVAPPAAPPPAVGSEPPALGSERKTAADGRREQEALVAAFSAEPIEPAWASKTGGEFQRALEGLRETDGKLPGNFQVTDLTCRSKTCLARLSFPTMLAAEQARSQVVIFASDLPCERRLYLGEEGQGNDAFEAQLLLNCSQ